MTTAETTTTADGSHESSESEEFSFDDLAESLRAAAQEPLPREVSEPSPDKRATRRRGRPRKGEEPGKTKRTKIPGSGRRKDLSEDLTGTFAAIGIGLMAFAQRNPALAYDAKIILQNGEALAKELNELAQRNPAVYRALFYFVNAGDMSKIALALSNIAVPILANHKVIPVQASLMLGHEAPPWLMQEQSEAEQQMPGEPLR